MTVEETFYLLAEAAGVRNPNPDRENRGLCPAHGDSHNPGLVFRIADSGKLVTHCFARDCTPDDIADSIGVSLGAFFPGGTSKFSTPVPRTFHEMSLLDLLKLLPLGMSFDEQREAVFRCLSHAFHNGAIDNNTIDIEQPISSLAPNTIEAYLWEWMRDTFDPDKHNWHDLTDILMSRLRQLNRDTRTHTLATTSAIPMRKA